ncbi:tetratricopeptide repeat protein [Candidatus Nitrosotalea bavarica]|uniref:tetratricopeptide repeat protein n=1 Tax=Candidatus Nitrosotalea bavarica TaxID=1903277 RepID=UPI000C7038A7|nr:tetratricopeptide repeat protein [Candidatus Nitrosotalea bavarica]
MTSNDYNYWYGIGNERAKEGNNDDALIAYDKALELDPNHISSWNNKGIVLSRLNRFEEAIMCYDAAIEIAPEYANAWYNKANALRNFGQSLVDKANDDRNNAPKMINRSIALFDSAEKCYEKGDTLSGKK